MYGHTNIISINTKQAKEIYQSRKPRRKLCKTNAAIWCNEACREKQLTSNYISIKINGKKPTMPENNTSCHTLPS